MGFTVWSESHLLSYFTSMRSEGSDETDLIHRLVDELYKLKSNKIYVMSCYVILLGYAISTKSSGLAKMLMISQVKCCIAPFL